MMKTNLVAVHLNQVTVITMEWKSETLRSKVDSNSETGIENSDVPITVFSLSIEIEHFHRQ